MPLEEAEMVARAGRLLLHAAALNTGGAAEEEPLRKFGASA